MIITVSIVLALSISLTAKNFEDLSIISLTALLNVPCYFIYPGYVTLMMYNVNINDEDVG